MPPQLQQPQQPLPPPPAPAPAAAPAAPVSDRNPEFPKLVVDFMDYLSGRYGNLMSSHDIYCDQLKQRQAALAARRAQVDERERALLELVRKEKQACDDEQAEIDRLLHEQVGIRRDFDRERGALSEDFRDVESLTRRLRTAADGAARRN